MRCFIAGRVDCLCLAIQYGICGHLIDNLKLIKSRGRGGLLSIYFTCSTTRCYNSMLASILGVAYENHTPINHFMLPLCFRSHFELNLIYFSCTKKNAHPAINKLINF